MVASSQKTRFTENFKPSILTGNIYGFVANTKEERFANFLTKMIFGHSFAVTVIP